MQYFEILCLQHFDVSVFEHLLFPKFVVSTYSPTAGYVHSHRRLNAGGARKNEGREQPLGSHCMPPRAFFSHCSVSAWTRHMSPNTSSHSIFGRKPAENALPEGEWLHPYLIVFEVPLTLSHVLATRVRISGNRTCQQNMLL